VPAITSRSSGDFVPWHREKSRKSISQKISGDWKGDLLTGKLEKKASGSIPTLIALAVNLGVPPLLFVQVLYGHLFYSSSVVTDIEYSDKRISYRTFDPNGIERIKLTFKPKVLVDGKEYLSAHWKFGTYRGAPNVLTIHRHNVTSIEILDGRTDN
jgi:hypothetical protein